jgi:hypothetical protein
MARGRLANRPRVSAEGIKARPSMINDWHETGTRVGSASADTTHDPSL